MLFSLIKTILYDINHPKKKNNKHPTSGGIHVTNIGYTKKELDDFLAKEATKEREDYYMKNHRYNPVNHKWYKKTDRPGLYVRDLPFAYYEGNNNFFEVIDPTASDYYWAPDFEYEAYLEMKNSIRSVF